MYALGMAGCVDAKGHTPELKPDDLTAGPEGVPRAARPDFCTFFLVAGLVRNAPEQSPGTLLTDFQAGPSILNPIRAIFDDLGRNQHFGVDLDLLEPDLNLLVGISGSARNADLGSDPLRK